jgi:ABC-type uncharacterized transport system substrate-binding protein
MLCAVSGCNRRRAAVPPTTPVSISAPLREVAILASNGYTALAAEIDRVLPRDIYKVITVDVENETSARALQSLQRRTGLTIVAIGLPAARIARDQFSGPVIFSQVFDYQELLVHGRAIRGVSALPPLDLQVAEWKKLDPKLRRIGLIVARSHTELIAQAENAVRVASLTLVHETSSSDRETLYVFKRMASQIDGLWLIPDDRSVSPSVLRELMSYATSHGVRVCVFNDALLQWGAYMSATPTSADTARALRRQLDSMARGTGNAAPLTTVSELLIRVNVEVAARMGLPLSQRAAWVVRSPR